MKEGFFMNATDVRRDWSNVADRVVRERPQFIRRTHDRMVLAKLSLFESMLDAYQFSAEKFEEDDGSVSLFLKEIDLIENAVDEETAKRELGKAILEYAEAYYKEFPLWSTAPNTRGHIPYVLKALILDDVGEIGKLISICKRAN